jgi:cell division protein FtsZ
VADDILRQAVQGISDIITIPGIINRDFADVKAIMQQMGYAVMGTATASGTRRAIEAAQRAIASPLLEAGAIDGARGILINITGSSSLKLTEVNEASTIIQSAAHEDANIIFGAVLDDKMKDAVKITVIATGFRDSDIRRRREEFQAPIIRRREPIEVFDSEPEPEPMPEHIMMPEAPQAAVQVGPEPPQPVIPPPAIPQDDLDVPAFLRKRNDIM